MRALRVQCACKEEREEEKVGVAGQRILVYFKVNPVYCIDFVCVLSVRLHKASVLMCA